MRYESRTLRWFQMATALACVPLGALASGSFALVTFFAFQGGGDLEKLPIILMTLLLTFLPAVLFMAIPLAVIALPLHLLLILTKYRSSPVYGLAGVVVGFLFDIVTDFPTGPPKSLEERLLYLTAGGVTGLGGALAFWTVRRPDRD